jgi:3-dehydroquinate synthetase
VNWLVITFGGGTVDQLIPFQLAAIASGVPLLLSPTPTTMHHEELTQDMKL